MTNYLNFTKHYEDSYESKVYGNHYIITVEETISGTYFKVYHNGLWLGTFNSFEDAKSEAVQDYRYWNE